MVMIAQYAPAWALLNPASGRWETACDQCAVELAPVWLPGVQAWAGRRNGQPVVLVPQRAGDGLARGDWCHLCQRAGRHATWDGARWLRAGGMRLAEPPEPAVLPAPASPDLEVA